MPSDEHCKTDKVFFDLMSKNDDEKYYTMDRSSLSIDIDKLTEVSAHGISEYIVSNFQEFFFNNETRKLIDCTKCNLEMTYSRDPYLAHEAIKLQFFDISNKRLNHYHCIYYIINNIRIISI